MSGGETVAVAFARAGLEMVLASVKAANDAERVQIETMLEETHAQLAAIPRLAPELDAITERHLARVRATDGTAHKVGPRSTLPLVTLAEDARLRNRDFVLGADLPVEGEDPDDS